MIFVDTNVIMYAVGGRHPLRERARAFFDECQVHGTALATSAEVLQELLHVYLPVDRLRALDAARMLVESRVTTVWPVEAHDVHAARALVTRHPELGARDLMHLATCRRYEVQDLMTFDRALAGAFGR